MNSSIFERMLPGLLVLGIVFWIGLLLGNLVKPLVQAGPCKLIKTDSVMIAPVSDSQGVIIGFDAKSRLCRYNVDSASWSQFTQQAQPISSPNTGATSTR